MSHGGHICVQRSEKRAPPFLKQWSNEEAFHVGRVDEPWVFLEDTSTVRFRKPHVHKPWRFRRNTGHEHRPSAPISTFLSTATLFCSEQYVFVRTVRLRFVRTVRYLIVTRQCSTRQCRGWCLWYIRKATPEGFRDISVLASTRGFHLQ